ncbi:MAG: MurT ligase domain-containing protein [Actinomycetaceae bacterium]|nr:MurT ligase domain-containing protein [Actinomycetaceae bacterium]
MEKSSTTKVGPRLGQALSDGAHIVVTSAKSVRKGGVRVGAATLVGGAAAFTSRLLGKGAGGMIGGRVAQRIDPQLLAKLSNQMTTVLVTGTNGKSTTTRMLAAALAEVGKVATNRGGDNMDSGISAALMENPDAQFAVLEVDEMHLAPVTKLVQPAAIVLLNLSRDQLDRVGEITTIEKSIRGAVAACPQAKIIANIDDPLITSAAWDSLHPLWVAAGRGWAGDAITSPRGGQPIVYSEDAPTAAHPHIPSASGTDRLVQWQELAADGEKSQFYRPRPDVSWSGTDFRVGAKITIHYEGAKVTFPVNLPGRANRGNAAQAFAAALALGATPAAAGHGIAKVSEVAGRYATFTWNGTTARMLLAKNPAGWQESLSMLDPTADLVVAVNGQVADGIDLSWLWDVDFAQLAGRKVWASGERGADLVVRLAYAGVDASYTENPLSALAQTTSCADMLLNYTSFRDCRRELIAKGALHE